MKTSIKAALITGIFGIIGTVVAAFIGSNVGEKNVVQQLYNQITTVNGNNNTVTINSVDDLINEYSELTSENESLRSQNTKYYDELEEAKIKIKEYENNLDSKVQELEKQLNDKPDVQFKDIELSVNGEIIPLNSTDSSVIINNRTYYSDEFVKCLVDSNNNITIQDNTMYIGKIIKEQNALTNEWLFGKEYVNFESKVNDSYGFGHTNAIEFTNKAYVKYSLNNEYSYFKCVISMRKGDREGSGNIIIKADDIEIYKSADISKATKMFDVDIPINNCSILTIEYLDDKSVGCIVSDAIVYN